MLARLATSHGSRIENNALRSYIFRGTQQSSVWRLSFDGLRHKSSKRSRYKSSRRKIFIPPASRKQRDGDFPVQVTPGPWIQQVLPEVRDLNDPKWDDHDSSTSEAVRRPKPHEVRAAIRGESRGPSTDSAYRFLADPAALKGSSTPSVDVMPFDVKRDVPQKAEEMGMEFGEDTQITETKTKSKQKAAKLEAEKAQKKYKWMPNPYSGSPGAAGLSETDYYARYFDNKHVERPQGEANRPLPMSRNGMQRERISPRRFWYQENYTSPDPKTVCYMRARELKVAMVNEAHEFRKGREMFWENAGGRIPPPSLNREKVALWEAFGRRAVECALGPVVQGGPQQRCSMISALRFLQTFASVQAGGHSAMNQIVSRVAEHYPEMKPKQFFFLLQALSRLRLQHPKTVLAIERMSMVWGVLHKKSLVKTANAVAKLDLAGNVWAKPLKLELAQSLPRLEGQLLANLKGLTVMELLDPCQVMVNYLSLCAHYRSCFVYTRHLQMVELHVHLLRSDVLEELRPDVKLFLEETRAVSEDSRRNADRVMDRDGESNDEESSSDSDDDEVGQKTYDKRWFTSTLHADLSRVLNVLGLQHQNKLAAGPLTLDVCHLPTMSLIEANPPWQYYRRSTQITAQARRRHELLRAMGFKVIHVPYFRWDRLTNDKQKIEYLKAHLPKDLLQHRQQSTVKQSATT